MSLVVGQSTVRRGCARCSGVVCDGIGIGLTVMLMERLLFTGVRAAVAVQFLALCPVGGRLAVTGLALTDAISMAAGSFLLGGLQTATSTGALSILLTLLLALLLCHGCPADGGALAVLLPPCLELVGRLLIVWAG